MTNWTAVPSKAYWYGEAIFAPSVDETTYNYGYSAQVEEPEDVYDLLPSGATLLEYTITRMDRAGFCMIPKCREKDCNHARSSH